MKKDLSTNVRMIALTEALQEASPTLFAAAILLSYLMNAALTTVTLAPGFNFFVDPTLSYWIVGIAAIIFQFFRLTMVLGGMLHPRSDTSVPGIVKAISTLAFLIAFFEVLFSLLVVPNPLHRASMILFAESFVIAGYAAEMFYISRAHRTVSEQLEKAADTKEKSEHKTIPNPVRTVPFQIPPIYNGSGSE